MWPALIAAGASIAGSLLSNQASAKQAQKQMDFQEEMSNSAHTREVADLRNAGLNPILSAMGSGASTPGGAQGSVNDLGSAISSGLSSGAAVAAQKKEAEAKDAQIENTHADSNNKRQESALIANQTSVTAKEVEQKALQNAVLKQTLPSMIKKAKAEGDYSEINQIMGIIQSGASSAGSILNIGTSLKDFLKGKK